MSTVEEEEFPLPFMVLLAGQRTTLIQDRKSDLILYVQGLHMDMKFQRQAT